MILNQTYPDAPLGPPDPPANQFHSFSIIRVLFSSLIVGAITVAAMFYELPLLAVQPGPAFNATGFVKLEAPTSESKGSLHLTTVTISRELSAVEAVISWVSPRARVIPRSAIFPPGKSDEDVGRETAAQMSESQLAATYAALQELGYELESDGVWVRGTVKGQPADGKLEGGDVITSVDGKSVRTTEELQAALRRHKVGDTVKIGVRRGTETKEFSVSTVVSGSSGSLGNEARHPVIGVTIEQSFKLPFKVSIKADDIGGPSAGLMFALAIVDLLDPADLTGGRVIAGTGTIDAKGRVGAVGGVSQKVQGARCIHMPPTNKKCASATVFLVPKEEGEINDAQEASRGRMRVIAVSSLKEAVAELKALR